MPKTPKPVESFGPEILQALIEGSKRRIEVPLPYRKAVFFRQRANQLRSSMRSTNHAMLPAVSQTRITILWGTDAGFSAAEERRSSRNVRSPKDINTPSKLIISPADSDFTDALRLAGVEIKDLTSTLTVPKADTAEVENEESLEDMLNRYVKEPNP